METHIIETQFGPVRGRQKDGVYLFAGIPYASPPIDDLRFKATQPHPGWQQPRDALRFGPAAPQTPTGGLTSANPVRWNEDCLTLNISTPACDDGQRAVLVWIHGGAYRTGQGAIPWYNGARFSQNGDIVVVSINYRLGALGFTDLTHLGSDYATSAVNGMLDQLAALRWVQDNIEAFGGSPNRVTLAGESAGAFSVCNLLSSNAGQGLFQRAIAQSGGAQHTLPQAASQQVTERFLDKLGVSDVLSLAAISTERILAAQGETIEAVEGGRGMINAHGSPIPAFYPTHGNDIIDQPPLEAIAAGRGSNVALLTGSNSDETTLWGFGTVDEAKLKRLAAEMGAEQTLKIYRRTRPDADPESLLVALTSDNMFRIPALRVAEARQTATDQTWVYQFAWRSRALDGRLGATHALEIPFAFDNLDRAGVDFFIGPGDRPQHLADVMHQAWTGFIKEGDPGWASYQAPARQTMIFNDSCTLENDPNAEERQCWEGIR